MSHRAAELATATTSAMQPAALWHPFITQLAELPHCQAHSVHHVHHISKTDTDWAWGIALLCHCLKSPYPMFSIQHVFKILTDTPQASLLPDFVSPSVCCPVQVLGCFLLAVAHGGGTDDCCLCLPCSGTTAPPTGQPLLIKLHARVPGQAALCWGPVVPKQLRVSAWGHCRGK